MPEVYIEDTIASLATPLGEGGIAVLRVSGSEALELVAPLFKGAKDFSLLEADSHTVHYGNIVNEDGVVLDEVLVSVFKNPRSYTGEDVVEISCHGGVAVSKNVLDLLFRKGIRPAEPGEFTKRAFLNGKMDLTQAEAVSDLIHANSSKSVQIAMDQLSGKLSKKIEELKNTLMLIYANMEAYLDFPDEDLDIDIRKGMEESVLNVKSEMKKFLKAFERNGLIREGMLVVLAGKPNVGKSSLFNSFLERDRALVSELPNTTRDQIEEPLEIGGFYIRMMDTAGLISTPEHPLDEMGMIKTKEALEKADLILLLFDGSLELDQHDRDVIQGLPEHKQIFVVVNKSDLEQKIEIEEIKKSFPHKEILHISTHVGDGFTALEEKLAHFLEKHTSDIGQQLTKLRHKVAFDRSLEFLDKAHKSYKEGLSFEFIIVDFKAAIHALQELTGEVYSEDLLDVIFAEFCIGK